MEFLVKLAGCGANSEVVSLWERREKRVFAGMGKVQDDLAFGAIVAVDPLWGSKRIRTDLRLPYEAAGGWLGRGREGRLNRV